MMVLLSFTVVLVKVLLAATIRMSDELAQNV